MTSSVGRVNHPADTLNGNFSLRYANKYPSCFKITYIFIPRQIGSKPFIHPCSCFFHFCCIVLTKMNKKWWFSILSILMCILLLMCIHIILRILMWISVNSRACAENHLVDIQLNEQKSTYTFCYPQINQTARKTLFNFSLGLWILYISHTASEWTF